MDGHDVAELALFAALLAATGGVAGVIAGLLGVGGGILLVPAFFYVFSALGYDGPAMMQVCVATSLATIVFTSARSVMSHNRKGAVDWALLRAWAPGIAVGSVLGMLAAASLRSSTLMGVFGVLVCVAAAYLAFGRAHWRLAEAMPRPPLSTAYSAGLGFVSALMGIGGGTFGVPLLTLYGAPVHRAVATAAGFGLLIAVPSVIGFLVSGWDIAGRPPGAVGYVNLVAFAIIVPMTMLTTPLGVRLAHAMNPRPLKLVFAAFLAVTAFNMLRRAAGG